MEQHSEKAVGCEVEQSVDGATVSGAIDVANAAVVGQQLHALLTPGDVVVDCRRVTFLDVAGLRMLAGLGDAAVDMGAVVSLRCSAAMAAMVDLFGVREWPGLVLDRNGSGSS